MIKHGKGKMENPLWKMILSIALLSLAIVAYEVQLMHFLRIVQWSHFATMVIALALLGFGASGTVLTLWRKPLLHHFETLLPLLMISSGILMTLAVRLSRSDVFFLIPTRCLLTGPSS
jgi:hypothetical protein